MAIYRLGNHAPQIPPSAYIAKEATVIGRVRLGERTSVWPGAVIRADDDTIDIGDATNVQDGAVMHVDPGCPLKVGANVTIGHQAMLHGCTVGDGSLIGIRAVIYNHAVIGRDSIVGAGALVTEGKTFPDRSLIVGVPAKLVRQLTDEDLQGLQRAADSYVRRGGTYGGLLEQIG
jgi:carbonic anhydrase/acetyltransferase-like protein (isoleucine patch superfamily)